MFCLATLPSEPFMILLQAETKNKEKAKMNPVHILFGNPVIRTVNDSFASGNQEQEKAKTNPVHVLFGNPVTRTVNDSFASGNQE